MAAVLGGTQSLHTNSFDEALALPTEQSARIAPDQQIIGYESGAAANHRSLAGSYYIESLTNEIEKRAAEYLGKIKVMGGMLRAIERGYVQLEIRTPRTNTSARWIMEKPWWSELTGSRRRTKKRFQSNASTKRWRRNKWNACALFA
jgi:methylmalonyl-CoA mutase N-terminal domain/subunit